MLPIKTKHLEKSHRLVFGFLLAIIGFYLASYTYISNKRQEIFDGMNMKVYEGNEVKEEVEVPDEIKTETPDVKTDEKVVIPTYVPRNNYYIGTISIPKINLKAGFTDMNSKENNVEKNVAIMKTSTYPDVENGNFILAAHSGVGKLAYFNNLYQLGMKDQVTIEYKGKEYLYQIDEVEWQTV